MAGREPSAKTRAKLSAAQRARWARGIPEETRARRAEANRRRFARQRVEVAERLKDLAHLTDTEASVVVRRDRATVRSIRNEFKLPGAPPVPVSERDRDKKGRLLPLPPPQGPG